MPELYHLHLKGRHDEKWKEKKELNITPDFTNRLGKKINEFNDCTTNPELQIISNIINSQIREFGYQPYHKMPIHMILEFVLKNEKRIDPKLIRIILKELREITYKTSLFKRESAMEDFRKNNKPELPSRMHCVYATTENGIKYWTNTLIDNDIDIFKIETAEEPFRTDEQFIPNESFSYEEMYSNSFKYWNPKQKNISEETAEYLIKGRIKVLEKVAEIKRPR